MDIKGTIRVASVYFKYSVLYVYNTNADNKGNANSATSLV